MFTDEKPLYSNVWVNLMHIPRTTQDLLAVSTVHGTPTNALEHWWLDLFTHAKHPAIILACVLFVWHELIFWTRYLPYVICDRIPMLARYKIQQV